MVQGGRTAQQRQPRGRHGGPRQHLRQADGYRLHPARRPHPHGSERNHLRQRHRRRPAGTHRHRHRRTAPQQPAPPHLRHQHRGAEPPCLQPPEETGQGVVLGHRLRYGELPHKRRTGRDDHEHRPHAGEEHQPYLQRRINRRRRTERLHPVGRPARGQHRPADCRRCRYRRTHGPDHGKTGPRHPRL